MTGGGLRTLYGRLRSEGLKSDCKQQQLLAEDSDQSQDSHRLQGNNMLQESAVSVLSEGREAGMSGLGAGRDTAGNTHMIANDSR